MPTYVYKFVETGETIEVQQGFHDATLTEIAHPDSGEVLPVKKVFTPVGVTFKGSGFFKTDNRGKKSAATSGSGSADSSTSSGDSSSTSSASAGAASSTSDTKSAPTTETKKSAPAAASTPSTSSGGSTS